MDLKGETFILTPGHRGRGDFVQNECTDTCRNMKSAALYVRTESYSKSYLRW